jgi:hypothetical protein
MKIKVTFTSEFDVGTVGQLKDVLECVEEAQDKLREIGSCEVSEDLNKILLVTE